MTPFTIPIAFFWLMIAYPITPGHIEYEKTRCIEEFQGLPIIIKGAPVTVFEGGITKADIFICYDPEKYKGALLQEQGRRQD